MKKSTTILIVVLVIIIAAGAWYWWWMMAQNKNVSQTGPAQNKNVSQTGPAQNLGIQGSPNQTNTGRPAVVAALNVAHDAALGDHLAAANGMTLYNYTKDALGVSNCIDQCASIWPPYIWDNKNPLTTGDGIAGVIGTITRADGKTQITFNGLPLYFYSKDKKPGDTTGNNFNGVWFVAKF